jgi:hypothetical protein
MKTITGRAGDGNSNPFPGVKQAYKRLQLCYPRLPALMPGDGQIIAHNGKPFALMQTESGGPIACAISHVVTRRYDFDAGVEVGAGFADWLSMHPITSTHNAHKGNGHEATAFVGPGARVKTHIDAALDILAAVEKRAAYLDSHDTQIAAE